jgi:hypothetical protein
VGSSFANMHVRIGAGDPATGLETIETLVTEWLEDRGFGPLDDGSSADRSVVLAIDPGGDWINVYDEAIEIHEDRVESESLGIALASNTDSLAIATSVFDSDLAWLAMFAEGGLVAELVHGAEMDGSGQWAATLAPDYERWRPLLVGGSTPDDLERIWTADQRLGEDDRYVFVEDRLADACGLFGIDAVRATVGYRYLDQLPTATDMRTLPFRIVDAERVAASIGTSLASADRMAPGLYIYGPDSVDAAAGTGFELMLQVANLGSETVDGVLLWAQGPPLEAGIVRLDEARSVVLSAHGSQLSDVPFQDPESSGLGVGAPLEDVRLGGFPSLTTSQAAYVATFQAQAGIRVKGVALRPGSGRLVFAVAALADIDSGHGEKGMAIDVEVRVH